MKTAGEGTFAVDDSFLVLILTILVPAEDSIEKDSEYADSDPSKDRGSKESDIEVTMRTTYDGVLALQVPDGIIVGTENAPLLPK